MPSRRKLRTSVNQETTTVPSKNEEQSNLTPSLPPPVFICSHEGCEKQYQTSQARSKHQKLCPLNPISHVVEEYMPRLVDELRNETDEKIIKAQLRFSDEFKRNKEGFISAFETHQKELVIKLKPLHERFMELYNSYVKDRRMEASATRKRMRIMGDRKQVSGINSIEKLTEAKVAKLLELSDCKTAELEACHLQKENNNFRKQLEIKALNEKYAELDAKLDEKCEEKCIKLEADISEENCMYDYAIALRVNSEAHRVCDIINSLRTTGADVFDNDFALSREGSPVPMEEYWDDFGDEKVDDNNNSFTSSTDGSPAKRVRPGYYDAKANYPGEDEDTD
jgi:hypothetical protein